MNTTMRIAATLTLILLSSLAPKFKAQTMTTVTEPKRTTLAALREHYRPLLVFAPSPENIEFRAQIKVLGLAEAPNDSRLAALRDLKIVVIPLLATGSPVPTSPSDLVQTLSQPDSLLIRHKFGLFPKQFRAILIGMDGIEKKSWDSPIELKTLEAIINSMPMRQQELQDKANPR